ncbi:SIR2 family protein [Photobacterium chitinilyticum]|uniref:SIR2 family protein n=1 Tax=Photobacterium chitinilyticum TaxID=2485123 RepID=UPI003D10E70E
MENSVLFGNGLNRISDRSVSWKQLLDKIKSDNDFSDITLPNTMIYERIFMEKHESTVRERADEMEIKKKIAEAMREQGSNSVYDALASLNLRNYMTTNYDYAFAEALGVKAVRHSIEDIYSLRRRREYIKTNNSINLWHIHGEIDHPKSIMLGLDHYCGSVSKLDAYVKGRYKYKKDQKATSVISIENKIKSKRFCLTSWVDLFFSTNVHIIGFSLDYSETDIWWVLNKRARILAEYPSFNRIYYYVDNIDSEKKGLLQSFGVEVVESKVFNNEYSAMYSSVIGDIASSVA